MKDTILVTRAYPEGEQNVEFNISSEFDIPIYTIEENIEKPKGIEVNDIAIDLPPIFGNRFRDTIERLHYAFWKPPASCDTVITSGLSTQPLVQYPDQHRIHYFHGIHRGSFGFPARDTFSDNTFLKLLQMTNRLFIRTQNSASFDVIDTVVANSEFTARMIETHYDVEVDKVIYPSFVETDLYSSKRDPESDFYLYVGRLADVKGVEKIVEAFNELGTPLKIAGKGPLKEELERIANPNVELLGYVSESEKRQLLSRCKGFVHNTIAEPFGIVLVEALAAGTPIIGTDTGNIPYLVDEYKTGILFSSEVRGDTHGRPKSPDPIIDAIKEAESIEWDHERICESAEKYDRSNIVSEWNDLLTRVR